MKKIFCVIMAIAMMLSMSVVSFAATTLPEPIDGVITLTEDVVLAEQLVIESPLTINLNGHKLTTYANEGNYDVVVKSALTINGEGSVHVSGTYGFGLSSSGTGSLTIENGTFTSADTTYYMIGGFGGKVTIKDGTFTTPYCVVNSFDGYDCKVEISGGVFTVTDTSDETASTILGGDNNDVSVSGGTFSNTLPAEYLASDKIQDKEDGEVRDSVPASASTTLNGAELTVGVPFEFEVTTKKNDAKDTMVIGVSTFNNPEAIEKLEYYEKLTGEWYELDVQFGPETGFPLADATSTLRVTFKTAGEYSLEFILKDVASGETVCGCAAAFTVVEVTEEEPEQPNKPSKDDDDDDDDKEGIKDIVTGDKKPEGEENPNTGAPVMIPVAAVAAALCGAYISKKR